jgi:hypothetical protein
MDAVRSRGLGQGGRVVGAAVVKHTVEATTDEITSELQ